MKRATSLAPPEVGRGWNTASGMAQAARSTIPRSALRPWATSSGLAGHLDPGRLPVRVWRPRLSLAPAVLPVINTPQFTVILINHARTGDWWKQGLVHLFGGGMWWSTASAGQCDPTTPGLPAAGCTWRAHEVKRVSKVCADQSIGAFVMAADTAGCFGACTAAERANSSSSCWIHCFFATLLGPNATSAIPSSPGGGMPLPALSEAWRRPFASESAEEGGCPAI